MEIPDYGSYDYNLWINYFALDVGLNLGARLNLGVVKVLCLGRRGDRDAACRVVESTVQQRGTPIVYDLEADTDYQMIIASLPLTVGAEIPLPGKMAVDLTATLEVPLGMFGTT